MDECELTIENCSVRGFGLAAHPTKKGQIEVAHAIPGDRVRVALMRRTKRVQKGRLLELIAPSDWRNTPRCQHASLCGGCAWQAMRYDAQLHQKEKMLRTAFGELTPVSLSLIPCAEPWQYRNKMEFTFSENRAGTQFLGLMIAHAEPYVFNLEQCHIAPAWMSDCVQRVRSWWQGSGLKAYHPHHNTGTLRYLTLRSTRLGQKMIIFNVSEWNEKHSHGLLEILYRNNLKNRGFDKEAAQIFLPGESDIVQAQGTSEGIKFVTMPTQSKTDSSGCSGIHRNKDTIVIREHRTTKGVPTIFSEQLLAGPNHMIEELRLATGTLRFKISPSSFFQPNPQQAERLYDLVLQELDSEQLVYDLYCGAGTLSLAASLRAKRVIGIELHAQAVQDAKANALLNGIENVRFLSGDVGRLLAQLEKETPDAVIVDPPRAGLDPQAIHYLKKLRPHKIIYVSCNPVTQAENIRALGYRLISLQGVDQFPHTPHLETVAVLHKR
jgi:23S rRNA (uracil1939-C5)-methyltransferase